MGRIFETRKHVMFARWDKMSKLFARIGKEITIAVKAGGPNPEGNPALKRVMQNARAANMPKDKVESAIKKASGQNATQYEEVLYEGYAPHGIAILIETATDNLARTVPNIRTIFNKNGGNMGNTGSVAFLFNRVGSFRLNPAGLDQDALELELIDHGLEEMGETTSDKGETQILVRCAFTDFGAMQKALEDRGITPISAELEYVPTSPVELADNHAAEVLQLIDKLEQDDDVQKVYSNLA